MSYRIHTEQRANQNNLDGTIYVLTDAAGTQQAEIWPAFGFNCYRWRTPAGGQAVEVLYADPQMFNNGRPTRGGIPVLFPFPNRIREGRFAWEGKTYQLPLNDSTNKNAIHGFTTRKPWRVVDQGADGGSAWLTGEFHGSKDAPESLAHWPADYVLRMTYRMAAGVLRIEATVRNPDTKSLPFGLGYHPYFSVPLTAGETEADCKIEAPARGLWELQDSLPTGKLQPVDAAHDLTRGRALAGLNLDDVYGDLPPATGALRPFGRLWSKQAEVKVAASPGYRELVVFTPPHRKAVCLEPYTCPTDAVNLQARGVDAGWLSLPPGGEWSGTVEVTCRGVG